MKTDTFGSLVLRIEGSNVARFIDCAAKRGIYMECISRIPPKNHNSTSAIRLTIALAQFNEVVCVIRECHVRMHIEKKSGLPFIMAKFKHRQILVFGMFLVLLALTLFSQYVWIVDINGCSDVEANQIRLLLAQNGYEIGSYTTNERLQALPEIICTNYDRIAWAGVKKIGVRLVVTVVEATVPIQSDKSSEPRDLFASEDALVVRVIPLNGHPTVTAGDAVKRGDCLISGHIGTEETPLFIRAKGVVIAQVAYTFSVEIPPEIDDYTDSEKSAKLCEIDVFGFSFKRNKYKQYREVVGSSCKLNGLFFPFEFLDLTQIEQVPGKRIATQEELEKIALSAAQQLMIDSLDKTARIISKRSSTNTLDNGAVRAIISIVAEKNIAVDTN